MIRVLIVDDQQMIRIGLTAVLGEFDDITVAGDAADGLAALAALQDGKPDVILMDIRMPGIDGVEAIRRIRDDPQHDPVKIIVLTTFDQEANVYAALHAGANGVLSKSSGPHELAAAIRDVASGGGALSAAAAATLIGDVTQRSRPQTDEHKRAQFEGLTPREREVVLAVAEGRSNTEIAERLFLSPATVKTHVNRAMLKLDARNRAQLVAFTHQAGLLD
jgi:DNA-binding NarL/FixJ family response regulator